MQAMQLIAITIRQDIQSVLDCDDFSQMTKMLMDYLQNYIEGDYYKLQFQENLTSGESQRITDLLIEIERNDEVYGRLVDECFDKMDTVNRQAMITFITRQMGLQLIACAPSDKYESVGTLLENVLFVWGNLSEHTRDVSYFTSPSFGLLAQQSAGDNDSYAIDPALFAAVEEQNRSHFAAEEGENDTWPLLWKRISFRV